MFQNASPAMLIQKKIGSLQERSNPSKTIDWLALQWYETNKRIQRKQTQSGREVALKFLQENPALTQGDILYEDSESLIAVTILPCECLVIVANSLFEMASISYEIGNKHLPLFFEDDALLVPFEKPLFDMFMAQGYAVKREQRQLLHPLKTTVAAHESPSESLFSKILKRTTADD